MMTYLLYLALLSCLQSWTYTISLPEELEKKTDAQQPMVIDHSLIMLFDGTYLADVAKILALEHDIKQFRGGQAPHTIEHQRRLYSLADMILLEKEFQEHHRSRDLWLKQFRRAYNDAIEQTIEFLSPHLADVRDGRFPKLSLKQMYCTLIEHWAHQRKLKTPLAECNKYTINQYGILLKKLAPSFAALDTLLADLYLFLEDLKISCKKSYQLYTAHQQPADYFT